MEEIKELKRKDADREREIAGIKSEIAHVYIRDPINFGLKRKAICSGVKITFTDEKSRAWGKDTSLFRYLQQANTRAHHISIEELNDFIEEHFDVIIHHFSQDAETDEQQASSLTSQKKICVCYLNLRFSFALGDPILETPNAIYADKVAAFGRMYEALELRGDASLCDLYNKLREKVDQMPETQRNQAVEQWASLCDEVRANAYRIRRVHASKNSHAIQGGKRATRYINTPN
ncbi:MAG: hypothetical protein LQ338_003387 [Usnochroma carphineum]|nr:MAG: hypothetical protein LQ338_003387 [Usnochroma carphineum]